MEKEKKIYCLFSGRHILPENLGAIASKFDFTTKEVVKSNLWEKAVEDCFFDGVKVIVTGFTPALTQFIGDAVKASHFKANDEYMQFNPCNAGLILLHFDAKTGKYWEQCIF